VGLGKAAKSLFKHAAFSFAGLAGLSGAAFAACDLEYKVQDYDTLFSIAENHYGDHEKWALIYYANQDVLAGAFLQLSVGSDLFIPCEVQKTVPDATPLLQADAEMTLVTGSNYAPFTDREWPGNGLVTELVSAALELSPQPVPYAIGWEDDWSKHLFPLLDEKTYDMGFPWLRPDCVTTPNNERCANFHFSEPLFLLPIMLFRAKGSDFAFDSDADIIGATLCRPTGYFTHDLDRAGRRWLTDDKINLVQAESPDACFALLTAGKVDAVTVNLFLGAGKIVELDLRDQVEALERPLSEEGLHVIISKRHWRGTTYLYRVNAGLEALRASGRYKEIVSRHLEVFWQRLE